MLEIGSLVDGKYRILRKVGQGGMSVVYMAINERANKTWAIKEIRKDGTQNYEVVKQGLIVETDMLKRLDHPHLPSIIDVIDEIANLKPIKDSSVSVEPDFLSEKTNIKLNISLYMSIAGIIAVLMNSFIKYYSLKDKNQINSRKEN